MRFSLEELSRNIKMISDNYVVAIIPARGGSKGIPRKNIKLLNGKPLISYSITNCLDSKYIDRVIVSTEDNEIAEIATLSGATVIPRPPELSEDDVPLDPVVFHALKSIEYIGEVVYDVVLTIQPTSPLITGQTIDNAIMSFVSERCDTLISVKKEPHLYWIRSDQKYMPLYKERKNRQYLDPIYKETGSIFVSTRGIVSEKSRIGGDISLFELPPEESIDIDTYQDWMIAENILGRKMVVFRVAGSPEIGLGHVYRALTIASKMAFNNEVLFLIDCCYSMAIDKISQSFFKVITFDSELEMHDILKELNPDIIINDILDTSKKDMLPLKEMGFFVVNFEDLGEGGELADVVINSLYEYSYPPENHYYGHNYVCLRDEFFIFPHKKVSRSVNNILVSFGGTDPNNLTLKTLKALELLGNKKINITLVIGLGYSLKNDLFEYVNSMISEGFSIDIKENISMMAKEILGADLVLTSNGRTIYEITSVGTPFISISQNERESRHLFVHYLKGVIYLGMAYNVSEKDIASAIDEMITNYDLRKKINNNLLMVDLKGGMDRIFRLIFDKYRESGRYEVIYN